MAWSLKGFAIEQAQEEHQSHDEHGRGVEFSELLFLEKPVPCQSIKANHYFANTLQGSEHQLKFAASYSFSSQFGVEIELPYVVENYDDETNSQFGHMHLALKAAHFAMAQYAFGYGLGFGIPLQDEAHEHHHSKSIHLEPYFSFGYSTHELQTGLIMAFEIPTNGNHVENEFTLSGFVLMPINRYVHVIGELKNAIVINGEEKGENALDVSGGCRIYLFGNEQLNIGLGFKLPLDNESYDYATLISLMYHY